MSIARALAQTLMSASTLSSGITHLREDFYLVFTEENYNDILEGFLQGGFCNKNFNSDNISMSIHQHLH